MSNIVLALLFATGEITGSGCSGVFILDGTQNGSVSLQCPTVTPNPFSAPAVVPGNVSVYLNSVPYYNCVTRYVSGWDGITTLHLSCPPQPPNGEKTILDSAGGD